MPHVAYYKVLSDDVSLPLPHFRPGEGETIDTQVLKFDPVDDIELNGSGGNRPLLCYMVDLNGANDFKLRVEAQTKTGATKKISEWTFDGDVTRQFMDPFRSEFLNKGQTLIRFRKVSGTGGVVIRNVIVFYQRDV